MPRKGGPKITDASSHDGAENEVCSICNLQHATEECPLVNSGLKVEDNAVPSKAVLTLPGALEAKQEDGKWHVIARESISKGVQFGPMDAPKASRYNTKCSYPLKVFTASSSTASKQQFYFLDTSDEDKCNWMVLVPFSNDPGIRNCICYQLKDQIYFTVVKDISPGEPLIVGYSPGYLAKLSVPPPAKQADSPATKIEILPEKLEVEVAIKNDVLEKEDHDYVGVDGREEKSDTGTGIRRSTRKRKIIDDDIFVFELANTSKKGSLGQSTISEDFALTFLPDDTSRGFWSDDAEFTDREAETSEDGGNRPKIRNHFRSKGLRFGAVLALEEWKCKFCPKIESSIAEFANHLIEHYKSVGTAKTEKLRAKKESQGQTMSELMQDSVGSDDVPSSSLTEDSILGDLNATDSQEGPQYPYVCDICVNKRIFNRAEYLIRHLRNHTGEFFCVACKQAFTKETYLEHNCPFEEPTGESFTCSECNKTFNLEKKLRLHLEWVHSKAIQCSACQKSFTKNDEYENHKCSGIRLVDKQSIIMNADGVDTNVLRKCDWCDETFLKAKDLEKHFKTHGEAFFCTTCSKELSPRFIKTHSEICEAVFAFATGKAATLRCPKCSQDFDNRDGFRYHVATHTHPAMCPMCNLRLPSTTHIKSHICSRFQCDGCQEEFVTLISLKKHISTMHGTIDFYCFECALPFVTQNGYASHRGCGVKDNLVQKKKSTNRRQKEEGMYVCEVCGATYTKWSSLKTHRYTHGPKRFVCSICGKAFHRREMLQDHEFVHQEAQFECSICNKKVKSKKSLDVHMQIHKGNKRFKCDQCDKAFCQKINLITHKMVHLPPEKKGFYCPHPKCKEKGKKFASKEYLGFHMEGHTNGANEICNICGRGFIKPHMLNQHKRTAHGNHTYNCEFCSVVVRQKHSLTRHLKKRHMDMQSTWNVKGYLETRFVPGDGEYIHNGSERRKSRNENCDDVMTYAGHESDDMDLCKVDLLTEVVDVDATCEVETEEIAFASDNMILPDSSNMMILQVKDGGEIVLTLAPSDGLPVAGATVVEGVIVEDVNTLQLQ